MLAKSDQGMAISALGDSAAHKDVDDDGAPAARGRRTAILMCTFNGASFVREQIDSIRNQTVGRIDFDISDDNSKDDTLDILNEYAQNWEKGSFSITKGPGDGFSSNFRSMILKCRPGADYVAFCDQDDVWLPEKLETAIRFLETLPSQLPAVFCGRTLNFSDSLPSSLSPLFPRPPSFRNALVQSIAGGNTMVLNRAAFELVQTATARTNFVSHDWWVYQIVSGAGGMVHYSAEPLVRYRQHGSNLIGANNTWAARLVRIRMTFEGRFRSWTDQNLLALSFCADLLTEESRETISKFKRARYGNALRRLYWLWHSRVFRQTKKGNVGLYIACFLGLL